MGGRTAAAAALVLVCAIAGCGAGGAVVGAPAPTLTPGGASEVAATAAVASEASEVEPSESESPNPLAAVQGDEELLARFTDAFADSNSGWIKGKSGRGGISARAAYRAGAYELGVDVARKVKGGGVFRSYAPEQTTGYRQVEVSVDVRKTGARGPVGVMCFQRQTEASGYDFLIDSDGLVLIMKRDEGKETLLGQDVLPDVIRPRGGNRMLAKCDATGGQVELELVVNGQQMLQVTDAREPLFRRGMTGVLVNAAPGKTVEAVFDDFVFKGASS